MTLNIENIKDISEHAAENEPERNDAVIAYHEAMDEVHEEEEAEEGFKISAEQFTLIPLSIIDFLITKYSGEELDKDEKTELAEILDGGAETAGLTTYKTGFSGFLIAICGFIAKIVKKRILNKKEKQQNDNENSTHDDESFTAYTTEEKNDLGPIYAAS